MSAGKIGFIFLKLLILLILYLLDIIIALLVFLLSVIFYVPYIYLSTPTVHPKPETQKHIVIIGYQFAGFEIHRYLQKSLNYKFTIIEPKEYFEYTPSVLHVLCNPSNYGSISFPLTKCFDSTRSVLIHGKATSIDSASNNVKYYEIKSKEEKIINYDYCFICTGSKYAAPVKISIYPSCTDGIHYNSRKAMFESVYSKLNDCTGAVGIIGGGPVGVEIMGEVIETFPDKKITIFDALPSLCPAFPETTRSYIETWTKKHDNVTLKLNAAIKGIEEEKGKAVKLKLEKETLEFDMIFKCWGFRPNSEILQNNKQFEGCLTNDKFKFIVIDEWMRVKDNIFALGDVIDHPRINEIKLIHTAELHSQYLSAVMIHLENDKNDIKSFKPYHEWLLGAITKEDDEKEDGKGDKKKKKWNMPPVFTISLGSMDGTMGFGNILFDGFISNILKWFIECSQCRLYQRKIMLDVKIKNKIVFKMYPIGYRIFDIVWKCAHVFTLAYIKHFNKQ